MDTHDFKYFVAQKHHISIATFVQLYLDGHIVDGRNGGLVIGRSHAEGNIYFLAHYSDDFLKFAFTGHMEGGEYLVNHLAYSQHRERIHEINQDFDDEYSLSNLSIGTHTRVINTTADPFDKAILMDHRDMFIVNKYSTAKHLEELEQINNSASDFVFCDFGQMGMKDEA